MKHPIPSIAFALAVATLLAGCSGGDVPISGKVTFNGQPVKGGTLVFAPIGDATNPGRPGGATVAQDGSFTGTLSRAGKYKLSFTAAPPEATEEQLKNPKFEAKLTIFHGLVPKQSEIEVKAGQPLEIELMKGS